MAQNVLNISQRNNISILSDTCIVTWLRRNLGDIHSWTQHRAPRKSQSVSGIGGHTAVGSDVRSHEAMLTENQCESLQF